MLGENCQRFFDSDWTKKLAKKRDFYHHGDHNFDLTVSCDFCNFLRASSTSELRIQPTNLPVRPEWYYIRRYWNISEGPLECSLAIGGGGLMDHLQLTLAREAGMSMFHTISQRSGTNSPL